METPHLSHEERVVKVIVDHWVILMRPLFLYLVGWLLIVVFYISSFYLSPIPHSIVLFVDLLILWVIHHWLFIYFFHRELSTLIVTNKRLIDFRFLPFEQKDIIFVDIKEIREIENSQHGLLKNLFDYGDLVAILEGNEEIHFYNIPKPAQVLNLIQGQTHHNPHL